MSRTRAALYIALLVTIALASALYITIDRTRHSQWVSVLAVSSSYSVRGNSIYYNEGRVAGADARSFLVAVDGNGNTTGYAKDCCAAYVTNLTINGADPSTFEPIYDSSGKVTPYSKDQFHVFDASDSLFSGSVRALKGIDPKTFQYLDEYWLTDQQHIYDQAGDIVAAADPKSFNLSTDHAYARDATHVFYLGNVVDGADPRSFVSYQNSRRCGAACYFDSEDKQHRFFNGEIVERSSTH